MLIHIDASAVLDVASTSATAGRSHDCIENLLVAHYQGDHVVSMDPKDIVTLRGAASAWSRRAQRALEHIDESFAQIEGLREEIAWSMDVGIGTSFDGKAHQVEHRHVVRASLHAFHTALRVSFSVLLGENLTDAQLYHEIGRIRCDAWGWDQLDVVLEPRGGGGDTTVREYEGAAEVGRIVLTIADTDQKHPNARYGNTFKKLENASKKRPHYQRVRMLPVRTAEALVPLEVYGEVFEPADQRQDSLTRLKMFLKAAPAEVLRYAHLKDGIVLHQVDNAKSKVQADYWLKIAKNTRRDKCKRSAQDACTKREECGCYVVDALGGKALSDVVAWMTRQKSKKEMARRFGLLPRQASELATLADEVMSWGIAHGPLRT